jgi:hypothetical protein
MRRKEEPEGAEAAANRVLARGVSEIQAVGGGAHLC